MMNPKARVRLIDKNKLSTESIEVLNSLDKIYVTFRKLKNQENIYFLEIEIGMKLSWAIRDYIRALNSNNEKDREMAVEKMKLYLAKDIFKDDDDEENINNNEEFKVKFKSGTMPIDEYKKAKGIDEVEHKY